MDDSIASRRQAIGDRHPAWIERTLDAYLGCIQGNYAARPLIITDTEKLTYGDVDALATRIAGGLSALGIGRSDRVGLLMANYPIAVPLLFGIWRAGAVAVAINTLYGIKELDYVLRESGCALLISMASFGSRRFDRDLDRNLAGWRDGTCPTLPELRGGLIYDDADPRPFLDALPPGIAAANPAQPHDPAVIMFTSGTTGAPKGVMQTHDNLLRAAYALSLIHISEPTRH